MLMGESDIILLPTSKIPSNQLSFFSSSGTLPFIQAEERTTAGFIVELNQMTVLLFNCTVHCQHDDLT